MRGPNDEPHPWFSGKSSGQDRSPWLRDGSGKAVVYWRHDVPPSDGPRLLFPEAEPEIPGDKGSAYEFSVAMLTWIAGRTRPATIESLGRLYASVYLDDKEFWTLNGLDWTCATDRTEWLMTLIENASHNSACREALREILACLAGSGRPMPPELLEWYGQDWEKEVHASDDKWILREDTLKVAERLAVICTLLHAVADKRLPKMTRVYGGSELSICDAIEQAMRARSYKVGMGFESIRKKLAEEKWFVEEVAKLREFIAAKRVRPDRSNKANSMAILQFMGLGTRLP